MKRIRKSAKYRVLTWWPLNGKLPKRTVLHLSDTRVDAEKYLLDARQVGRDGRIEEIG